MKSKRLFEVSTLVAVVACLMAVTVATAARADEEASSKTDRQNKLGTWIGWVLQDAVPETLRAHLNLEGDEGVFVREVVEESPAAKAGIRDFDVIVEANGEPVHGRLDLFSARRVYGEQPLEVVVLRGNEKRTIKVTPEPATDKMHVVLESMILDPGAEAEAAKIKRPWIGVVVNDKIPDEVRAHLQLDENQGAVVVDVLEPSPAAKAGLRKFDVVLEANGRPVQNATDLRDAIRLSRGQPIPLVVLRGGEKQMVEVTPEFRPEMRDEVGELRLDPADLARNIFQLPNGDNPIEARVRWFGPATILHNNSVPVLKISPHVIPANVSIEIIKEEKDSPITIRVRQGDETRTITEKELDKLPADIRLYMRKEEEPWSAERLVVPSHQLPFGTEAYESAVKAFLAGQRAYEAAHQKDDDDDETLGSLRQKVEELEKSLQQLKRSIEKSSKE